MQKTNGDNGEEEGSGDGEEEEGGEARGGREKGTEETSLMNPLVMLLLLPRHLSLPPSLLPYQINRTGRRTWSSPRPITASRPR